MTDFKDDLEMMKKAQEIDGELYDAQVKLDEIPGERERNKAAFEAEKASLKELEDTLKKLQLTQKEKEGELAQKEEHIKKLDVQLSQVKTNKEYSANQQEIASLKADNSLLEEDVLKIFDELESAQEEIKKEKARIAECEKAYKAREEELNKQEKDYKDIQDKYKNQRMEFVNKLSPDVKDLYTRILEKKQGRALVKIHDEVCTACQMQLRAQVVNEIYLGTKMVICDNCSRILYCDPAEKENSA